MDVVLAIDSSGSMDIAAEIVRKSAVEIITALKREQAAKVRLALVIFNDSQNIYIKQGLTEDPEKILAAVNRVRFNCNNSNCIEAVGHGVAKGLSLLTDKTRDLRQVVVITDDDGLMCDKEYKLQLAGAKRMAKRNGVAVEVHKLNIYEALADYLISHQNKFSDVSSESFMRKINNKISHPEENLINNIHKTTDDDPYSPVRTKKYR